MGDVTLRFPDYDLELDYTFSQGDVERALSFTPHAVSAPSTITFSKNVFLPLTTACKYTCAYCVYYDVPGKESLMSPDEIHATLERGAKAGCKEALITFGDAPDDRYQQLHATLQDWGYASIHHYHVQACEWALEHGLLPHSNPGDMAWPQMSDLKELNVSMGVMLETTAHLPAHAGRRHKTPGQRLQTLEYAGRQKVPFTTGLLIGIGESWQDRALSLLAIKKLHDAYGHIQEVIIQNVVPNQRWKQPTPNVDTLRRVVSMARGVLPASIEVQVPPNLAPINDLLDCGVGDLGGVSPVTSDYINPDYAWPQLARMEQLAARHGRRLEERLAVYPQYIKQTGWLSPRMESMLHKERFRPWLPAQPTERVAT